MTEESVNQESGYAQGNPAITSKQENLVTLVAPKTFESGGRMRIFVQVGNGSESNFLFAPAFIKAAQTQRGNLEGLHVYTYDELVQEERTRQMWAAIAIGMSGAANSMAAQNAGYSYTTGSYGGTYSGNVYSVPGSSFGGSYTGTYTAQTYNPYVARMAQQQAQAQTQEQMRTMAEYGAQAMAELGHSILRLNTVRVGQFCGGQVEVDAPVVSNDVEKLGFEVRVGEEMHRFYFRMRKCE